MKHRILGRQGLDVSALGLGTMGMTMAYGPSDDDGSVATSRTAYDVSAADVDLTPPTSSASARSSPAVPSAAGTPPP